MITVHTVVELRAQLRAWRSAGETVALVPTMGNLHEGHLSLIREAQRNARRVVASIFVNPLQFGPNEDFAKYPRTLPQDSAHLLATGCNLLFAPPVEEMYPGGQATQTRVQVPLLGDALCGRSRPGHFDGVSTVVTKLFNLVQPDVAVFGEKDFQQLAIIRKMTADLAMPIRIVGVPTVREANGLAMSSRNGYLNAEQKHQAAVLYRALCTARDAITSAGRRDFAAIENEARALIEKAGLAVDYFEIRHAHTLAPASADDDCQVIAVAAKLGATRLIDNLSFVLGKP